GKSGLGRKSTETSRCAPCMSVPYQMNPKTKMKPNAAKNAIENFFQSMVFFLLRLLLNPSEPKGFIAKRLADVDPNLMPGNRATMASQKPCSVTATKRSLLESAILNPNSEFRNLVDPLAPVGNEDWQFFHHELRFTEGADHSHARSSVPFFRHFFTGMTAPAFGIGVTSENMAINLSRIVFMQPGFTSAVDIVAVIEHEARSV